MVVVLWAPGLLFKGGWMFGVLVDDVLFSRLDESPVLSVVDRDLENRIWPTSWSCQ